MTTLLDEPRIAYASRKVQRLREDVRAWRTERGVWDDLVRDANREAEDLFAFDTDGPDVQFFHLYSELVAQWRRQRKSLRR